MQGNSQKTKEITKFIRLKHPNYLIGLLHAATLHILNGQYEKVPELLGAKLELKNLFPERKIFHVSELTSFYKTNSRT